MSTAGHFTETAQIERLREIAFRSDRSMHALLALREWIEDLPTAEFEQPETRAVLEQVQVAAERVSVLIGATAKNTDARKAYEACGAVIQALVICIRDIDRTLKATGRPRNFTRQVYPDMFGAVTIAPVHALHGLLRAFEIDLQWLGRWQAEEELPAATNQKERMRRLRARRDAGFRIANVAVHENDIRLLQRLGLLSSDFSKAELDDALNLFLSGALTAAYSEARPRIEGLEEAPETRHAVHYGRFPELRSEPLIAWSDRIRRIVSLLF
jgi:hypothetical protein